MHMVIGGTPAQRAQALAAHLAGELSGRYEPLVLGVPDALGKGRVGVVSLGASDGGGPAVLSGANGVGFTAPAPLWFVLPAYSVSASAPAPLILTARVVPALDPPPRPV